MQATIMRQQESVATRLLLSLRPSATAAWHRERFCTVHCQFARPYRR
jgi:hypothetical protein